MNSESINLSSEQEAAIGLCNDFSSRLASVTGGAGTGKTTILKNVYAELSNKHKVQLAAPTGRAAKRIQEATGIPAITIHRLLEFPAPIEVEESKGEIKFGEPKRNRWNPLPYKGILIDEASMIASKLWSQVLDALPSGGFIRLFGDINQLPPIDPENKGRSIFEKILDEYPSIYLTHNFRSDDNLIENANRILRGSIPIRGDKFEIIISNDPVGALREVVGREFHTTNHQVLAPMRKNATGSVRISSMLRTKFNLHTDKPRIELERWNEDEDNVIVLQDDKVLWTKNDYCLNVMNGELGTIEAIDEGSLELILDDNRQIIVPPRQKGPFGYFYDPRKSIDLAYCMTVHKAQGSEFETVIYFMCKGHAYMLNRNNFYTGVTRAKKKVLVITDRQAMGYAMRRPRK